MERGSSTSVKRARVQAAADPVTLDHQASLARMASQEGQETTVNLDFRVVRQLSARLRHRPFVPNAPTDRKDPTARQDHQVSLDQTDLLDHQAKMAPMVNLVHPDHLAQTASQAPTAPEETPESQARRRHQSPESQEHQASPDLEDLQDHLDHPDPTDKPEAPDRRDHQAPLDPLERTANPAKTALLAHPDRPARRASAPSIAPSTAVSSSKMALDANCSDIQPTFTSRRLSKQRNSLLLSFAFYS
jgi:hypothetical protein